MELAYQQALKAYKYDEVPVGAVLIDQQGNILARGYNKVEKKKSQLAHAELLVLARASKEIENWRLSSTILYVTVQPCLMCLGALYLSRVCRVVYGVESLKFGALLSQDIPKAGIYKNLNLKIEYMQYQKSKDLLQLFFKKRRNRVHDE